MKIGIVTTWFERGAGVVSRQILEALTAAGMEVFVYARGERYAIGDPRWDRPNVRWGRRLHWSGSGKIDRADFEDWLRSNQIEALVFNEQRWWQPILWAKARGIKCGAYVDYYTKDSIPHFSIYDFLLCNTKRHFEAFQWHAGAKYIPWGTETDVYVPSEKASQRFTFFHSCGWDTYRKGTDLVVAAFQKIETSISADLVIHSQIDIKSIIPASSRILVRGGTVRAPGLYHLGDVYVYPSRLEGIGLTICEALSSGLPVITTDEGPMSEFVTDGVTGYLVPVERRFMRADAYYWPMAEVSVDRLADAMLRAYNLSEEDLKSLKGKARFYAKEFRSWKENASIISNIIETSSTSTPTKAELAAINRHDYAGVLGKMDYLLKFPPARWIGRRIFSAYRLWRQPQLYGDHSHRSFHQRAGVLASRVKNAIGLR